MTTKEFLLDQFTSCYDENGWFVALKNTLNNLSATDAVWKPDEADNSIFWHIGIFIMGGIGKDLKASRRLVGIIEDFHDDKKLYLPMPLLVDRNVPELQSIGVSEDGKTPGQEIIRVIEGFAGRIFYEVFKTNSSLIRNFIRSYLKSLKQYRKPIYLRIGLRYCF